MRKKSRGKKRKEHKKVSQDIAPNNIRINVKSPIGSCINRIASTTYKGGSV